LGPLPEFCMYVTARLAHLSRFRQTHNYCDVLTIRCRLRQVCTCILCVAINHNPVFPLCINASALTASASSALRLSPPRVPFVRRQRQHQRLRTLGSHNLNIQVVTTNGVNGCTSNDPQDGTRVLILGHNRGKPRSLS
jgi:hypothetical protein